LCCSIIDILAGGRLKFVKAVCRAFVFVLHSGTIGLVRNLEWVIPAICLALVWPKSGFGEPILARIEQTFSRFAQNKRRAVVALGAAVILTRTALLAWLPVPQPKVHDEFSYLLAADTYAHGRLANPPHPLWVFFDTFHVIQHPTYASMYPPGQGFVLAVGQLLGQPWIGVLLSVAAMCMTFTWMLQAWVPPEWALLGGVLVWMRIGVFSYWVNSYWGGAVAATGAALVLGAWVRIREHETIRDAILLGLGAGILAISRPLEGGIFFLPVAVFVIWWAFRCKDPSHRGSIKKRVLAPAGAVLVCAIGFVAYYNWRLTGNPVVFPHFLEQRMITTAILLWQHDKPPIAYANPQFDDFYHNFLPSLYESSWPAAVGQLWYKSNEFWEFFIGPALSIPFLALPWLLKERRNRLLFVQLVLSALGLWIVVYFHAHYAAPLMATLFVLLIQCMQHLRGFRLLGHAVGLGLTRLVVLFSLPVGPVYFADAEFFHRLFEWLNRHAAAALFVSLAVLILVRLAFGRQAHPSWLIASCELLVMICIVVQLCAIEKYQYEESYPYVSELKEPFRKPVEQQLRALPGEHLVLVRYSKNHNSGEEYVYNDADIDRAKIAWAREIPGMDLRALLSYFRNRKLWLYEPDEDDSTVQPYDAHGAKSLVEAP
jgi:hypothetical protein